MAFLFGLKFFCFILFSVFCSDEIPKLLLNQQNKRPRIDFLQKNKNQITEKSEENLHEKFRLVKIENNDLKRKIADLEKKNLDLSNKLKKYSTTHRSFIPSSLHSFSADNSFSQILESSQDDDNKLVGLENVTDLIDLEDQLGELKDENKFLKNELHRYKQKIFELEEVINSQDVFINDYEYRNNECESSLKEYVKEFSRELHQIKHEEASKNDELCGELENKNSLIVELQAKIKKFEEQAEEQNSLVAELQQNENLDKVFIEKLSLDLKEKKRQESELDQKKTVFSDFRNELQLQLSENQEQQNDLGFETERSEYYPTRLADDIGAQTDRSLTDRNFNFYGRLKIESQDVGIQTDQIVSSQEVSDEAIGKSKKSQQQEKHLQDYYFLKKGTLIRFAFISVLFCLFIFRNKIKNFICFYYPIL